MARPKKDSLCGAGNIKREHPSDIDAMEAVKKEKRSQFREIKVSTDDELAGDKFFYKNFHLSKMKEKYPQHPEMWTVDKYYPNAKGGPLYLDRVIDLQKNDPIFAKKKEAFKEIGIRYIQFKDGMELNDAKELLA